VGEHKKGTRLSGETDGFNPNKKAEIPRLSQNLWIPGSAA
jgi:hypothetical protein